MFFSWRFAQFVPQCHGETQITGVLTSWSTFKGDIAFLMILLWYVFPHPWNTAWWLLKPSFFYIAATVKSHPCRWYHERNWINGKSKENTACFLFLFGVVLTSVAIAVKEFLYPLFVGLWCWWRWYDGTGFDAFVAR